MNMKEVYHKLVNLLLVLPVHTVYISMRTFLMIFSSVGCRENWG
jgi:hypothetical protein